MSNTNNSKLWSTSKQNWIKDVLSKSGTELMEISKTSTATTSKNGAQKRESKKKTAVPGV